MTVSDSSGVGPNLPIPKRADPNGRLVTVSDSSGLGGGGGGGGGGAGGIANRPLVSACLSAPVNSSPRFSAGAFRSGGYPNVRYMKSSDFCNADVLVK